MLALLLALAAAAAAPPTGFVRVPGPGGAGSLLVQKTEVSVERFRAFARATGYLTAAERAGASRTWKAPGFALDDRQPVVYVSFRDAEAYCASIAARLPTDVEWEHAARAGATGRHYWGEAIDGRYLWYRANSGGRPRDVGRKQPNRWGLHDVEGNVWEWALARDAAGQPVADRRGGSWVDCEDIDGGPGRAGSPLIALSNHYTIAIETEHRYDDIGFRCVRDEP
jgi:formylglycine-generating enzyme required for sulfatase activity